MHNVIYKIILNIKKIDGKLIVNIIILSIWCSKMICTNFFPNSAESYLQTLFFWMFIYAGLSSLSITLVTSLTYQPEIDFFFPMAVQIVFFLVAGVAYVFASRKDIRKAVSETKIWKVKLIRIFAVMTLLMYMITFMSYVLNPYITRQQSKVVITILSVNIKLSDISNWGHLTALCKFVSLLIDKEMDKSKRRPFKIALICFLLIGFSCLTVIALKLEYIYWMVTLRLVEISFLILCNIVFSIISGIQREIFSPESAVECV
jgi:hypothetical protein